MKQILKTSVVALTAITLLFSIACSKSESTGGDDPVEAIQTHLKAIFAMLKANSGDCAKALSEVEGYISKNKAELDGLAKRYEVVLKKMTPEEAKKHQEKMEKQSAAMLKESLAVMMEFGGKCPNEMAKISEAMSFAKTTK